MIEGPLTKRASNLLVNDDLRSRDSGRSRLARIVRPVSPTGHVGYGSSTSILPRRGYFRSSYDSRQVDEHLLSSVWAMKRHSPKPSGQKKSRLTAAS